MRVNKDEKNSTIKMLTLDDDISLTLSLQAYFETLGYDVDTECDPNQAINRIKENHYDILILDYLMRPINGAVVVRDRKSTRL